MITIITCSYNMYIPISANQPPPSPSSPFLCYKHMIDSSRNIRTHVPFFFFLFWFKIMIWLSSNVSWLYSYCSNYYSEFAEPIEMCDWCQSEERSSRLGSSAKKSSSGYGTGITNRSEYSGDKIKQQDREESSGSAEKGKNPSGTPSPRPTTRRYKLLKDVMC